VRTFLLCLITKCPQTHVKLCATFRLRSQVSNLYLINSSCNSKMDQCHWCPNPFFICPMLYVFFVSEWVGEWVGEWAGEWVSGWVSGWVSEWVSGWVNEWLSGCVIQLMKISFSLLSDVCGYEGARVVIPRSKSCTPAQLPAVALLPVGSDPCEAVKMYLCFGRHRSVVLCP
jgi:hypothetical protein